MSELYSIYTEAFLTGLADYAHITAKVDDAHPAESAYVTISQHLDADGTPLIVALGSSIDAFYALASGYSGVSLDGMEELAVDAVGELFNVINGHFSSRMRADGHAVSIIDPPRHCHADVAPEDLDFKCILRSPVGSMTLMALHDEFIPAQAH